MRLALNLFVTFVTSGATDVDKMLKIYNRDEWYNVAFHEFLKSIMLGDWAYYKEERSPICNIFNTGSEPNSSHFTSWRIIRALIEHRGRPTREGIGYVELSRLIAEFEDVFDNLEDFLATIDRLVVAHLVEPNTRSTTSVERASHVRVTSAGWYYLRYLSDTFAYLDLVLQDTPIDDGRIVKALKNSVYEVNNLADAEGEKLERVQARFRRVELFLDYLQRQEDLERDRYGLNSIDSPIADGIVAQIRNGYESERDWIEKRLRENRERYREEYAAPQFVDEEELLEISDGDNSDEAQQ